MKLQWSISRVLCAAGVMAAAVVFAADAQASFVFPRGSGNRQAAANSQANQAHSQILQELHATKQLLEQANHDYQGHRVKAIEHITKAIHELGGGQHHQGNGQPPGTGNGTKPGAGNNGGGKGGNEAQAMSDSQLKQAQQQLQTIMGNMSSAPAGRHAHQLSAASKEVNNALSELATALKIK